MAECVRALMPLNEKYTADPEFESRLVDRFLSNEHRMYSTGLKYGILFHSHNSIQS